MKTSIFDMNFTLPPMVVMTEVENRGFLPMLDAGSITMPGWWSPCC